MTFRDSVKNLVENLLTQTLNGNIVWQFPRTGSNQYLECHLNGFNFTFYTTWQLNVDKGWVKSPGWIIIASEDSSINFTVYSHSFPELVDELQNHLCNLYFNKFSPSEKAVVDRINDLTKKISLEQFRDTKIDNILDVNVNT